MGLLNVGRKTEDLRGKGVERRGKLKKNHIIDMSQWFIQQENRCKKEEMWNESAEQ